MNNVVNISPKGEAKIIPQEIYNQIVQMCGNEYKHYVVKPLKYIDYELGAMVYGEEKVGNKNPYGKLLQLDTNGAILLFKLENNKIVLLTDLEAKMLLDRLLVASVRLADSFILLTPSEMDILTLPVNKDLSLDDYKSYYLDEPIPLELINFSQKIGSQVTMWVNKDDTKLDKYNKKASLLISEQLDKSIKVYGEVILTKRNSLQKILTTYTTFSSDELSDIIFNLNYLGDRTLDNALDLSSYLNGLE